MILTKNKTNQVDIDILVDERIQSGRLNEILFIVPTKRKIRSLIRELITLSPNKTAAALNIETIGSYALRLLSVEEEANLVTDEASVLLLSHSFSEGKLNYFSQYREGVPFGTLERIKNVISEYKRNGITPDKLREEAEQLTGGEKIKAMDIAGIYENYQKRLGKIKLKEIGDVYTDLNSISGVQFEKNFFEEYPDVKLVIINGFDEFTLPEIEIINSTAGITNIELYVALDYYKYNPAVFSHLNLCHDRFTKKGFREIKDISTASISKFLSTVREKLSLEIPSGTDRRADKNPLVQITARNREEEIELIAKEIKNLVIEKRVEPNRICVVFNLIEKYSPVIRDRFKVYGIPFNLTDRFSLSNSPPVNAIIHLLEVLENDFYYKSIFRAFSSYFIAREEIDLSNLLKASVELKIVSGYNNWLNRINDKLNELSFGKSNPDLNGSKAELYKKAEQDIVKIQSLLKLFSVKLNPQEFYERIISLIFGLDFPSKLLDAPGEIVEKDIKALNTFINGLNEITRILGLEYGGEAKFSLRFYLNQLRTYTAFTRYNITEKPGYGVQITTLNEIRGLKFDYLFIAGLNDGDLPTRFTPEIFFSGSFAKEEVRHQVEERYLFYQALCAWNKGLYLTYPLFDEKKELVQSSFLKDFADLFEVRDKDNSAYEDAVYSKEELLEKIGEVPSEKIQDFKVEGINIESILRGKEIDSLRRDDPFGNSEFAGGVGNDLPEEAKNKLNEITNNQFSATQLENYAKCPYKFFVENILKLETIEEPKEELEAFEFGSLIHTILYEFYTNLNGRKIVLQNCSDEEFAIAEKLMFKIAEEKFNALHLNSEVAFYEREKLLGINRQRRNSLLYKFLEAERKDEEGRQDPALSGYIPSFFETGFGKVKKEQVSTVQNKPEIIAGNVKVKGKIDRIDINEADKTYKVIDYKLSGTKPTIEDLTTGISLQLPLYLFAAKELVKTQLVDEYKPAGAEIFSLKYSEEDFGKERISIKRRNKNEKTEEQVKTAEEMINICIEMINKYVQSISEGKFNLSTLKNRENKVCCYCDFRKICRIQEVS